MIQPDRVMRYVGYLYHPEGNPLRTVEIFFSQPNNWIKLRYMPLNYDGASSAYTWCEMFKIMRSDDDKENNPSGVLYDPSFRSDLFPYCRGNDNEGLKAARAKLIAKYSGVEKYIIPWGHAQPDNVDENVNVLIN